MPKLNHTRLLPMFLAAGLGLALTPAAAEDTQPLPELSLQLNTVQQLEDNTCRMIFVAVNNVGEDISAFTTETVLFEASGAVSNFTLFDFRDLPAGKTRVRQFDLPETECGTIKRILINGSATCTISDGESSICMDKLTTQSSTGVELSG